MKEEMGGRGFGRWGPFQMLDGRRRQQLQGCSGNRCRIDLPLFRGWPANETTSPWGWLCRATGSAEGQDGLITGAGCTE